MRGPWWTVVGSDRRLRYNPPVSGIRAPKGDYGEGPIVIDVYGFEAANGELFYVAALFARAGN
jgi:hypothetical protein